MVCGWLGSTVLGAILFAWLLIDVEASYRVANVASVSLVWIGTIVGGVLAYRMRRA